MPVDAGSDHGHLVHKAKVFQVVDTLLGFGIVTNDGAAFEGVEHLGGMKTQHRQVAVVEHTAVMALHAKGVSGVVDDFQSIVVGNFLDTIHITGVAVAVHRHDGGSLRGDGGLDPVRVEVERDRVDVHKHRFDTVPQQRMGSRHERIWCGDDFARDAQGLQGGNQCEGAVGEQGKMLHAQIVA